MKVLMKYRAALLFILLLVIGLYVYPFLIYKTKMNLIDDFKTTLNTYKEIEKLKTERGLADSLIIRYSTIENRLKSIIANTPQKERTSFLHNALITNADSSGVKIRELNSMDLLSTSTYHQYPFELFLRGSYGDVVDYITLLENSDLIVQIEYLQLLNPLLINDTLDVSLLLNFYLNKEKGEHEI